MPPDFFFWRGVFGKTLFTKPEFAEDLVTPIVEASHALLKMSDIF